MNALKAHYRYVEEQNEKRYREERKQEMERIKNMTPEEREKYEEEQRAKKERLNKLLSFPYIPLSNQHYKF